MKLFRKIIVIILFAFIFINTNGQTSSVNYQGNNGSVTVIQNSDINERQDSLPNKVISDTNKVQIRERSWFMAIIGNTNSVFVLLISIATFIGLLWKGNQVYKKKKKEEEKKKRNNAGKTLFLLIVVPTLINAQDVSNITSNGNKNSITVIQGSKVTYNLLDEQQAKKLVDNLKNNINLRPDLKQNLTYTKATYDLLRVISQKLSQSDSITLDNLAKKIQTYYIDKVYAALTDIQAKVEVLYERGVTSNPRIDPKPSENEFMKRVDVLDSLIVFGDKIDALSKYFDLINIQTDNKVSSYLYSYLATLFAYNIYIHKTFNGVDKVISFKHSDDKEMEYINKALQLWPENTEAIEMKIDLEADKVSDLAKEKGVEPKFTDYIETIKYIKRGINANEKEKTDPLSFYESLFRIYEDFNKYDNIISDATLVYNNDTRYYFYLYHIGMAYLKTGDYSLAESNLKMAYKNAKSNKFMASRDKIYPYDNDLEILKQIIVCEVLLNNISSANLFLKEGLDLFSDNKEICKEFTKVSNTINAPNFNIYHQNFLWSDKFDVAISTFYYLFPIKK